MFEIPGYQQASHVKIFDLYLAVKRLSIHPGHSKLCLRLHLIVAAQISVTPGPIMSEKFAPELALDGSPNSIDKGQELYPEAVGEGVRHESVVKITRISSTLTVLVAGVALFSDGYNAQISQC